MIRYLFIFMFMAGLPSLAQSHAQDAPLLYVDANNNEYLLQNGLLSYTAQVPERSSSGMYSGGKNQSAAVSKARQLKIWAMAEALAAQPEAKQERREMGTAILILRKGEPASQPAYLRASAGRAALEACLQEAFRSPSANTPRTIEIVQGQTLSLKGSLEEGELLPDISWAWSSQIACFPGTAKTKFDGAQVFYTGTIPAQSVLTVRLIPDDPKAEMSLYGYLKGQGTIELPPMLKQCIRCEADYARGRPIAGRSRPAHIRELNELLAIARPYQAVIAVAGAAGLQQGGYTLEVSCSPR